MVNGVARRITTEEATIRTASVEIKSLMVSGKQLTLAVFRQIIEDPIMDQSTGELRGTAWGHVNYHSGVGCDNLSSGDQHLHIVWERDGELRRSCVSKARCTTVPPSLIVRFNESAGAWMCAASACGWSPNNPDADVIRVAFRGDADDGPQEVAAFSGWSKLANLRIVWEREKRLANSRASDEMLETQNVEAAAIWRKRFDELYDAKAPNAAPVAQWNRWKEAGVTDSDELRTCADIISEFCARGVRIELREDESGTPAPHFTAVGGRIDDLAAKYAAHRTGVLAILRTKAEWFDIDMRKRRFDGNPCACLNFPNFYAKQEQLIEEARAYLVTSGDGRDADELLIETKRAAQTIIALRARLQACWSSLSALDQLFIAV